MSNFDEPQDPTEIRYYGGDETIHDNGEVNVEVDKFGRVVAVWFRCQLLRFTDSFVNDQRAHEMITTYMNYKPDALDAVVFREEKLA